MDGATEFPNDGDASRITDSAVLAMRAASIALSLKSTRFRNAGRLAIVSWIVMSR